MRWKSPAVAVLALMLTNGTLQAGTYVCDVPKSQTEPTRRKIAHYNVLGNKLSALLKSVPENKMEEVLCSSAGRSLLEQEIIVLAEILPALSSLKCPSAVIREYKEYFTETKGLLAGCSTVGKTAQPSDAEKCTPPSAPQVIKYSDRSCFTAKNTNTNSRCVFSFTYRLSNRSNPQEGGNVAAPGESERCTQESGVTIKFEKWTPVISPAR